MLDIIIPTLGRPDKLAPLLENIRAATRSKFCVYFVIEGDDFETAGAVGALVSKDCKAEVGTFGSCAAAVNGGYRASHGEFFAVVNDDCKFEDGWDEAALEYFSDEVHIVGLNDGSGDCKCFQMFRRSYIEEHSGVFDKPNTVYHE